MADAQASGACYGNIVWVQVPSIPFIMCIRNGSSAGMSVRLTRERSWVRTPSVPFMNSVYIPNRTCPGLHGFFERISDA